MLRMATCYRAKVLSVLRELCRVPTHEGWGRSLVIASVAVFLHVNQQICIAKQSIIATSYWIISYRLLPWLAIYLLTNNDSLGRVLSQSDSMQSTGSRSLHYLWSKAYAKLHTNLGYHLTCDILQTTPFLIQWRVWHLEACYTWKWQVWCDLPSRWSDMMWVWTREGFGLRICWSEMVFVECLYKLRETKQVEWRAECQVW